jgi:hypothetical protein
MFVVSPVAAVIDAHAVYRPNGRGVFDVPDRLGLQLCATHGARRASTAEVACAYVDRPPQTARGSGFADLDLL